MHIQPVLVFPCGRKTPLRLREDHHICRMSPQPMSNLLKGGLRKSTRIPMEANQAVFVIPLPVHGVDLVARRLLRLLYLLYQFDGEVPDLHQLSMVVCSSVSNGPGACPFETSFVHRCLRSYGSIGAIAHWWPLSTVRSSSTVFINPSVCSNHGCGTVVTLTLTAVLLLVPIVSDQVLLGGQEAHGRFSRTRIWDRVASHVHLQLYDVSKKNSEKVHRCSCLKLTRATFVQQVRSAALQSKDAPLYLL